MIVSEETKKKPKACLNHWNYLYGQSGLFGQVTNSDKFQDGAWIRTSKIVSYDPEGAWIETENTVYILGVPYDC